MTRRTRNRLTALTAGLWTACLLLLTVPAARGAENPHFLDPATGAHLRLRAKLDAGLAKKEDPSAYAQRGWVRLLYFADTEGAGADFDKALSLAPKTASALMGTVFVRWARGDDEGQGAAVRAFVERFPDGPESEALLCARRAAFLGATRRRTYAEQKQWLEALWQAKPRNAFVKAELARRLSAYAGAEGDFTTAWDLWRSNGHVPCWYVLGRLGVEGSCWFDEPLPPERGIDLGAAYATGLEKIRWARVSFDRLCRETPRGARNAVRGQGSVTYYLTYVKAPARTPVSLRIRSAAAWKLWVNGVFVHARDPFKGALPGETAAGATLGKGWNAVLVKTVAARSRYRYGSDGSALWGWRSGVRVTAPGGGPLEGLEFSCRFKASEQPATPARGFEAEAPAPALGAVEALEERCGYETVTVPDLVLLATVYGHLGLHEKSFALLERLRKAHRGWAPSSYLLARGIRSNPSFPYDLRRQKERALYEAAAALDPAFLPARFAILDQKLQKNPESVLDELKTLARERPGNRLVLRKLYDAYRRLGWRAERMAILRQMTHQWPGDTVVQSLWEGHYRDLGNVPKALSVAEGIRKREGSPYRYHLVDYWTKTGRSEKGVEVLATYARNHPEDRWSRDRLVTLLTNLGKHKQALDVLEEIRRFDPEDKSLLGKAATLHALAGDLEEARKVRTALLSLPAKYGTYDNRIRRAHHFAKTGIHEGWAKAYAVDAAALRKAAPGDDVYPEVSTVVLFEQRLVRFFGPDLRGCEEVIEQVVQIRNKAGGEKYGRLYSEGRILEASVILPDGRMLEPDPVQEGWNLALPKLDKGSVIHVRYLADRRVQQPREGLRDVARGPTLRRRDEAVLRLRYVVFLPEASRCAFRLRNLARAPKETREKGFRVLTWEFENLEDVERESFTPRAWEILPEIRFSEGAPLTDRLERELRSQVMDETVPDVVRRKARKLAEGAETRRETVRRIYRYCVEEIRQGWNRNPAHTLRKEEGQAAPLFHAMLRALGVPVTEVRYGSREALGVDWDYGRASLQGGVFRVDLEKGGPLYLAPGRFIPFGCLPAPAYGAPGVVVSRSGCRLVEIPDRPLEEKIARLDAHLTLARDGSAGVAGRIHLPGGEAAAFRVLMERYVSGPQLRMFVAMFLNSIFRGIQVKEFQIAPFALDKAVARGDFEGKLAMFASRTGGTMTFKPVLRKLELCRNFVRKTDRKFPLRLQAGFSPRRFAGGIQLGTEIACDRFRFTLPPGATARAPRSIVLLGEFGEYGLSYRQEKNVLHVERRIRLYTQDVPVDRYEAFKRFCRQVDQWEQETVEVTFGK